MGTYDDNFWGIGDRNILNRPRVSSANSIPSSVVSLFSQAAEDARKPKKRKIHVYGDDNKAGQAGQGGQRPSQNGALQARDVNSAPNYPGKGHKIDLIDMNRLSSQSEPDEARPSADVSVEVAVVQQQPFGQSASVPLVAEATENNSAELERPAAPIAARNSIPISFLVEAETDSLGPHSLHNKEKGRSIVSKGVDSITFESSTGRRDKGQTFRIIHHDDADESGTQAPLGEPLGYGAAVAVDDRISDPHQGRFDLADLGPTYEETQARASKEVACLIGHEDDDDVILVGNDPKSASARESPDAITDSEEEPEFLSSSQHRLDLSARTPQALESSQMSNFNFQAEDLTASIGDEYYEYGSAHSQAFTQARAVPDMDIESHEVHEELVDVPVEEPSQELLDKSPKIAEADVHTAEQQPRLLVTLKIPTVMKSTSGESDLGKYNSAEEHEEVVKPKKSIDNVGHTSEQQDSSNEQDSSSVDNKSVDSPFNNTNSETSTDSDATKSQVHSSVEVASNSSSETSTGPDTTELQSQEDRTEHLQNKPKQTSTAFDRPHTSVREVPGRVPKSTSLAAILGKTNQVRVRARVGLSKRIKVDPLHRIKPK